MASLVSDQTKGPMSRPWRARVKVDGVEEWLGNFASREEAAAVEHAFRVQMGLPLNRSEAMRRMVERERLRTGR